MNQKENSQSWKTTLFFVLILLLVGGTTVGVIAGVKNSKSNDSQVSSEPDSNNEQGVAYQIFLLAEDSGFQGTYEQWLASIRGENGANGSAVELRLDTPSGFLQWKYIDEPSTEWRNLLSIESLIGPRGTDGTNGVDGQSPFIGLNGNWWIGTTDTGIKAEGATGAIGVSIISVELISTLGDVDTYKITFSDSTSFNYNVTNGLKGDTGPVGEDGKSVYEIYITAHPEYTGDEAQWLNDLVSGNLGTKKTYLVTFDSNDGTEVDSQLIEEGKKVVKPSDPQRIGYSLDGWYINGTEKWVFGGYIVTENITLVASWTANSYSVVFDPNEGTVTPNNAVYKFANPVTLPTPSFEPNEFLGWYNGADKVENGNWSIANDVTLRARWIKSEYKVYYDYGYNNLKDFVVAPFGLDFTPLVPTRVGHSFGGWMNGSEPYSGGVYNYYDDLHLTALWDAAKYTISLDVSSGTMIGATTQEVTYGQTYTLPVAVSSTLSTFSGWFLGGVKYTNKFGECVAPWIGTENITLVAYYANEIRTALELKNVAYKPTENYVLMNDIDIAYAQWIPIGALAGIFTGVFDGDGYKISNFKVDAETKNQHTYSGLFRRNYGTIKNLSVAGFEVYVSNLGTSASFIGAIAGYNSGILENIKVLSGSVHGDAVSPYTGYIYAGGITGYSEIGGTFNGLENNASILNNSVNGITGGIFGLTYAQTVLTNSKNTGSVSGKINVGGLVGAALARIDIINSSNSGQIGGNNADLKNVGGIIGSADGNQAFTNVTNNGLVIGNSYAGGLIGHTTSSLTTINNCTNNGEIKAKYSSSQFFGGLVGRASNILINNSVNNGTVSGRQYVGGLAGYAGVTFEAHNVLNTGSILTVEASNKFIGGLLGGGDSYITTVTVVNSLSFGNINLALPGQAGAVVGFNPAAKNIQNTYYSLTITGGNSLVQDSQFGTLVTDLSIYSGVFFKDTLGWTSENWKLDNVDIANKVYPSLI